MDNSIIENDMQSHRYSGNDLSKKIFENNPLIGNYILSGDDIKKLSHGARKCIKQIMESPTARLSPNIYQADRVITIMVIHYAQNWSSSESNSFWGYIVRQFGYNKAEEEAIRGILCESVKNALIENNRFFLRDSSKSNRYKSSILVHALSTKETWMLLYDFLFKFYKENMDWRYDANDPIIERMVYLLKKKLEKGDESEEELQISSKVFYFQEGVKKLIVNRPNYTIVVFKRMLKRIDDLCNSRADNSHLKYIDLLGNEWFQKKVNNIASAVNSGRREYRSRNVAIDYSKIRASYVIDNGKVSIELPDIRLKDSEVSKIELLIMQAGKESYRATMAFYGDELGKTMIGTRVPIESIDDIRNGFSIRVQILCDREIIYDSGKELFKRIIVFKGKNEQNNVIIPGSYRAILPADSNLAIDCGEYEEIDENSDIKVYDITLDDGFALSVDGEIIAVDNADANEVKVVLPKAMRNVVYCEGALRYSVFMHDFNIQIIIKDYIYVNRFVVVLNDMKIELDKMRKTDQDNLIIYSLSINTLDQTQSVSIIDLESEKSILKENFIIFKDVEYSFNRSFYVTSDDYNNACLRLSTGDVTKVGMSDENVSLPYLNGILLIDVPRVTIFDEEDNVIIPDGSIIWYEEAKNLEMISIDAPKGMNVRVTIADKDVAYSNGKYEIGNTIRQTDSEKYDRVEIKLHIDEYSADIKVVALKECFTGTVNLTYHDEDLLWNKGIRYIGDQTQELEFKIKGNGHEYDFHAKPTDDVLACGLELEDGCYSFYIFLEKREFFSKKSLVLSEGRFVVGDINSFRFKDKKIKLNHIKYYLNDYRPVMEVNVNNLYVDQIKYNGTHYIGSEECNLPVYKGTLYYVKHDGTKVYYSFSDHISKGGRKKRKLNPVKLICMSEGYMIITDEEDDGLEFLLKDNKVCIIDYEYDYKKRIYGTQVKLADVYGYETEDDTNV